MEEIKLAGMEEWKRFAQDNEEGLIEECGSVESALEQCRNGGLRLGGGAAPEVMVRFE